MEDLRNAMRIVDDNAHNISEGDYLNLCNNLHKIYKDKSKRGMKTIVDYENFDIQVEGQTDEVLDHFHDYFYNVSMMNEENYLHSQIEYLQCEIDIHKPLRRVTKRIKYDAIREYCNLHGILLERYDEDHLRAKMDEGGFYLGDAGTKFEKGVKGLYKSYMVIENSYRAMYSAGLHRKIMQLWGWVNNLDDI
jgi:hypothetical protein